MAPPAAEGQYFGRNKVEYREFDFRVLSTEHFDVYHYPREETAARLAGQLAERWYGRLSERFDHDLDRRQPLVLYGSQPEFAQTNVVSGFLSDTVGGVTESARRRIVMPFAPTLAETDRVLGHEIVHAFQFDLMRRYGGGGQPLWFIEGMAEYLARGRADTEAAVWMRDAVRSGRLPPRERDAARRLSPYHYGHALWTYMAERFGDQIVAATLKPGKRLSFGDRLQSVTGVALETIYADWRAAAVAAHPGADSPAAGSTADPPFGRLQLGPALSPDGRWAVFFSERDRLGVDLFLADLDAGRIVRKLATTTASARYESLQPLRSAGAWSNDGRWFVFPAIRRGQATLVVLDMHRHDRDREFTLPGLGQILSASWAPDGRSIALSALAGGFTDLYVFDLDGERLRQVTDDPFADLHPAWSPDGTTIAFATDRYSTDLSGLRFGPPRLAGVDPVTGAVRALGRSTTMPAVNPQWAADGRSLYFIGTRGDGGRVLQLDLGAHTTHEVTESEWPVTGLTPTSAAISVAADAPVMAFTVYRNGRHQLEVLDVAAAPARAAMAPAAGDEPAADGLRAPAQAATDAPRTGELPTAESRPYTARLSLERIGQPYVTSGGGAFGTFVRGGGSLLFGDMLGDRRLGAAVQIGNRLRDAAFEVRFLNRAHRWNWGAVAELEPALRRYRRAETIDHDGEPALLQQADYLQLVQLRAAGLVAYPFSRGLRVEFSGGVRHAASHRDLRSQVSSIATGRVLREDREASSVGTATTVAEAGAALVGDTTVFGPTGPLLGSRYRFEVSPSIGSLAFARVLADYRQYFMPVRPYGVAVRLLHSGRYGRDAGDPRLLPHFLGSRYFVRGHGTSARRCARAGGVGCGDDLLGSRLVVANLELRMPLVGMLTRRLEYGRLPADMFVFADGGVVWSGGMADFAMPLGSGTAAPARRTTLSSIGAGLRVNAGGLPFELAVIRALDGPARGWSVDYGFRVGF